MAEVEKVDVGHLNTNCYLVWGRERRECAIVDPGDDAEVVENRIRDLDLVPKLIIATHAHFDHLLAVNELKLAYDIAFYMHRNDLPLLSWMRKSSIRFTGFDPGPHPIADGFFKEGDRIIIDNFELEVLETPGHTPGGVCFYNREDKTMFTGDTIFAGGTVGRTDFPYCNKSDLKKSIKKLLKFSGDVVIYPGHGEDSTLAEFSSAYFIQKNSPMGESSLS